MLTFALRVALQIASAAILVTTGSAEAASSRPAHWTSDALDFWCSRKKITTCGSYHASDDMKTPVRLATFCIFVVPMHGSLAFATKVAESSSLTGQTVTVISGQAVLISDGKVVSRPELGDGFRIEKDEGDKLWVQARNSYLRRSDVILYQDAIDYFTRRIKEKPSSNDFVGRGCCWRKREAIDLALSDFNEAIRLDSTNSDAYNDRGLVWTTKRDFEKALADFSRVIQLKANAQTALLRGVSRLAYPLSSPGTLFVFPGEFSKACRDFYEARGFTANTAIAYNNRGITWARMEKYDRAIADFDEAIRLDPNYAPAYENRGHAWSEKKDDVQSLADIERALRIDPNLPDAHNTRARVWMNKREYGKAIKDCDLAIGLQPNRGAFYASRAEVHARMGDLENTLADLKEVVRIYPPAGYNLLAWMRATYPDPRFRNGKEAVDAATRACELADWKNDAYIDTLSAALAEAGRFDEAIKRLQQANDLNPQGVNETRKKMMAAFTLHKPYRQDLEH